MKKLKNPFQLLVILLLSFPLSFCNQESVIPPDPADLTELMKTLKDQNSEYYLGQFRDSIVSLKSVELVAK